MNGKQSPSYFTTTQPNVSPLPDLRRLRLPVCRVLRLADELPSVVLDRGVKPERGDGVEPLAVLEELLHGLDAVGENGVGVVEPSDLEGEKTQLKYARMSEKKHS